MAVDPNRVEIPVVVDEDLSEDKLRFLLDLGEERSELDYKVSFDSSSTEDKVELAKDAIAISNTNGGYLLLGASNDGTPVGLPQEQYDELDGSRLANKINAYCRPRTVSVALHKHQIDVEGTPTLLALVLVRNNEGLPIFMSRDGTYPDRSGKGQKCAFREHDVYVRHDDQSVRMTPVDMQRFAAKAVEREKEGWMADATKLLAKSADTLAASTVVRRQLDRGTLMIDSTAFWQIVVSLLAEKDAVRLSSLVEIATNYAAWKWEEAKEQPPETPDKRARVQELIDRHCAVALDKLTLIAAAAIRFGNYDILQECLSDFAKLYRIPVSEDVFLRFPESNGTAFLLWTYFPGAVMTRLYALGGYAVVRERFGAVRTIAQIEVEPVTPGQPRQPLILDPDWHFRGTHRLRRQRFEAAGQYFKERAGTLHLLPDEATRVLDYLCQFDLLLNYSLHLRAIKNPFPNFAIHYPQPTIPIIERMVENPADVWGAHFDAREFAAFLNTIPERMEALGFVSRWRPYVSEVVRRLLDDNR